MAMTRVIAILAACAAVAWLVRLVSKRTGSHPDGTASTGSQADDPMDGVQWEPWTREVRLVRTAAEHSESWDDPMQHWHCHLADYHCKGCHASLCREVMCYARNHPAGDAPYIDNPVLVRMRDAYRGQPLGGT